MTYVLEEALLTTQSTLSKSKKKKRVLALVQVKEVEGSKQSLESSLENE